MFKEAPEAEVDYEGELISSLNDLQEERKRNKLLQEKSMS